MVTGRNDGELEGHEVLWCSHTARFDIRDGRRRRQPPFDGRALRRVSIVGGKLLDSVANPGLLEDATAGEDTSA
jgi:hypothetical protein